MKSTLVALAALVACIAARAHAGWYVVDNYEGQVGPYPVHLSLQKYDSFGSDLNVKGSYYYDKRMAPIPLYGKRVGTSLELCEVHNSSEYETYLIEGSKEGFETGICPFKLIDAGDELHGMWQDGKNSFEVLLERTASLDNTSDPGTAHGIVEIPYWGQTATHSFIGIYQGDGTGISIDKVKVINKSTGKVDQVLDPQLHDCEFGAFMTVIYQNIESEQDRSRVQLKCYSGGAEDISVDYRLDAASHSYRFVGGK